MPKKETRRAFIELGLKTSIGLPILSAGLTGCSSHGQTTSKTTSTEVKKLKILILGGTSFLGPHQIAYALGRGHEISTFTRGKTKPSIHAALFDQVEQLIGDRKDNLTALENRKWDAVIDNSGREAAWTKDTAELLKDACGLYLYTSSTGVYYPYTGNEISEDTKLVMEVPPGTEGDMKMEYDYGVMKTNSELEAIKAFGKDRTIVVRPTYMIGPADKTNRFIHWPIRLSRGGEVLVPGKLEDRVQYIDVRDTAEWMIRLIENKHVGTYNAVGPKSVQTMYEFVDEAKKAFKTEHTLVKIDDYDFLEENKVYYIVPWIIPIGNNYGSARASNKRALANGLTIRPLIESINETLDWWNSEAVSEELRKDAVEGQYSMLWREKELIEKWKQRG